MAICNALHATSTPCLYHACCMLHAQTVHVYLERRACGNQAMQRFMMRSQSAAMLQPMAATA